MVHWRSTGKAADTTGRRRPARVGLRLTGPRRLVLEVVRGRRSSTAEAVHQMVRGRLAAVTSARCMGNLRLLVAQDGQRAAWTSHALRRT